MCARAKEIEMRPKHERFRSLPGDSGWGKLRYAFEPSSIVVVVWRETQSERTSW